MTGTEDRAVWCILKKMDLPHGQCGYAEPYEQEKFEIDSWIPVIRAEGLIPRRSTS